MAIFILSDNLVNLFTLIIPFIITVITLSIGTGKPL